MCALIGNFDSLVNFIVMVFMSNKYSNHILMLSVGDGSKSKQDDPSNTVNAKDKKEVTSLKDFRTFSLESQLLRGFRKYITLSISQSSLFTFSYSDMTC